MNFCGDTTLFFVYGFVNLLIVVYEKSILHILLDIKLPSLPVSSLYSHIPVFSDYFWFLVCN